MFAWLVLTEQKLESRLSQYRTYLPRNPSCSKIPEASALLADEMILLCAAYTIRIQSPCELSSVAGMEYTRLSNPAHIFFISRRQRNSNVRYSFDRADS